MNYVLFQFIAFVNGSDLLTVPEIPRIINAQDLHCAEKKIEWVTFIVFYE